MSQKQTESTLLSMKRVLEIVPVSKTQLYRMIDSGEFPKQVPIGRQRVAFIESEVNAWFESRLLLRDEGVGAESRRARAIRAVSASRRNDASKPLESRTIEDAQQIFENFLQSVRGSSVENWWVNFFDGRVLELELLPVSRTPG